MTHDTEPGYLADQLNTESTDTEQSVLTAWNAVAEAWVDAVRQGRLESREAVTNSAIVNTILSLAPGTGLDIGCGEGWLCRRLAGEGVKMTGIDGVPGLIDAARQGGGGDFHLLDYDSLSSLAGRFDCAICNFSLLGKASTETVFQALPSLLNPGGHLVVQTLNPLAGMVDNSPYEDGWRMERWQGFGPGFSRQAPWYFRTLSSWINLFNRNKFQLVSLREPLWPGSRQPASLIVVGKAPG